MKKTSKSNKKNATSKTLAKKKVVVKKVAEKAKKEKKPTDAEILMRLRKWIPKLVKNTVSRYQNNSLSVIFNEADMIALAEDTSLEVFKRVKIGLKNPNHKDSVDLKGCESYFKRSFINQSLKLYEKYAKTDVRAAAKVVSSEEALAVAASMNLYSPEDSYIIDDQMKKIFDLLKQSDAEHNDSLKEFFAKLNKTPEPSELQHFESIIQCLLDGHTAVDICTKLKISNADFLRQKRLVFEFIKQELPSSLEDMMEHFESSEDYRVHTQDVNKRQKFQQEVKNYKPKALFYIATKNNPKNKFEATLYARIDMYDQYDNKSNKVTPKLIAIDTLSSSNDESEMKKTKDELWKISKSTKVAELVEKEGKTYLAEIKNKAVS